MTRRGPLRWCADDFIWFYELLPQPATGEPVRLEGFQRLIIREIFATGRVELLVLIPKGQAKTTLMAALAVFHLLVTRNANCYIGAADKIQADEMYRFAAHFVESEPELGRLLKVLRGTREIRSRRDQGFLRVLASDDSKQGGKRQGFNPTLALIDELHAHENDNLYIDMRSGLFKRGGILVTITTAGWDIEGVLGQLRDSFFRAGDDGGSIEKFMVATDDGGAVRDLKSGRLTIARKSQRAAMLEWALTKDDDWTDFEVVKLANPASWVTIESLADAYESLRPAVFKRYRCNLWTLAFDSWLPEGAWDALYGVAVPSVDHRLWNGATAAELDAYVASLYPPGVEVVGAIDMARYRDCAAITLIGPGPTGRLLPRAVIWRGSQDDPVDYEPTKRVWRTTSGLYRLTAAAFDPKYYDQSAQELVDEGLPMEDFPQSNERMCPAAADLRNAILKERRFEHDSDPILSAHIGAAVAKEVGDGQFKLAKPKTNGPPIDGCVSLAMANALVDDGGGSMYEEPGALV